MQRLVVVVAAIIASMGTASADSVTPAGCSTCTLDAQPYTGGATPFTLVNLATATDARDDEVWDLQRRDRAPATIPNARQPIASPVTVPGETITFPATGSGVYAGTECDFLNGSGCIASPFGDATTNYLGAVPGDSGETITFITPQHQLNLLWGTVDTSPVTYNQVTFNFSDGAGFVNGADVAASFAANGLPFTSSNTNAAVVITTAQPFTSVTLTASGTSFEFVPGVPVSLFAGTPGQANCVGVSVSALAQQYGGLARVAAALGYSSVQVLRNTIAKFCAG
jgi:hypothetical protein